MIYWTGESFLSVCYTRTMETTRIARLRDIHKKLQTITDELEETYDAFDMEPLTHQDEQIEIWIRNISDSVRGLDDALSYKE